MTPAQNTSMPVSPKELTTKLVKCFKAKLPVLIKGAPGVGKSDIVSQAAEICGYNLMIFHPAVSDPTDYKGLPGIVDGKAEFLPYGDLRRLMEVKKPTIAFLDDIGQAPTCVQTAVMQLLLARQVNGKKISDRVIFVAATNRRKDRAGVSGILEPVKSRFKCIYELVPSLDDWTAWAIENDIDMDVIYFLRYRPQYLNTDEFTADIVNHPCPRTWLAVSDLIKAELNEIEDIAGAVGIAAATDFVGFLRYKDQLPDLKKIIADPENGEVPDNCMILYAVCGALFKMTDDNNVDRIYRYCDRLKAAGHNEFNIYLGKDIAKKLPETKSTIEWYARNKAEFVRAA